MSSTMSEKILARASGKDKVEAGDIIIANIDVAMTHDLTGPLAVESFEKIGADKVWDSSKIVIPFDHQVPADSIDSANNHIIMRNFVKKQNIENFYDIKISECKDNEIQQTLHIFQLHFLYQNFYCMINLDFHYDKP